MVVLADRPMTIPLLEGGEGNNALEGGEGNNAVAGLHERVGVVVGGQGSEETAQGGMR